mmetsp:Transcript_49558/g.91409  ORF Transcript_49558/g.91409 Transcript_49558/m.91409 type:complete len:472 (-) Transcript_49558:107-1522(-)
MAAKKSKKPRNSSSSDSSDALKKRNKATSKENGKSKKNKKPRKIEAKVRKKAKKKQKGQKAARHAASSSSESDAEVSQAASNSDDASDARPPQSSSSSSAPKKRQDTQKVSAMAKLAKTAEVPDTEAKQPKKRTKAERITMLLEDRLSATARHIEGLQRRLAEERAAAESANLKAGKANNALESARAKLRQFASAAGNIKKSAAERIEKRDARIAQLQATVAQNDVQLTSLATSREALALAVTQYKRKVAELSARMVELGEEDPRKTWSEPQLDPEDVDMEELACTKGLPHHRAFLGKSALRKRPSGETLSSLPASDAPDEEVPLNGDLSQADLGEDGAEKDPASAASGGSCRNITFLPEMEMASVLQVASFKSSGAKIWIPHPGKKVCCDHCDRWVPTMQGFLLSDPARSQFMQERFLCGECGAEELKAQGAAAAAAVAAAVTAAATAAGSEGCEAALASWSISTEGGRS